MIKTNLPIAKSGWDQKELDAIQSVIQSGQFTMGENVGQCEASLAIYLGRKYCVMLNSGSSANLLMVASLFYKKQNPLNRGDEVIVPAVAWATSYSPLYQYGLKLKFVDIDLHTLNYDLNSLEAAVTDKTKLILAVNLLGNSNDYKKIKQIINNRNIYLLEDNCESLGAECNHQKTGTFGIMSSFSSFFSHHFSTIEGGFVSTDDEELYHILMSLRSHGWTRGLPEVNHVSGQKNQDSFSEEFNFNLPGYNLRPNEINGAVGVQQLKKIKNFINNRMINGKHFVGLFNQQNKFIIQKEIGQSSWFGFSFIITPESKFTRTYVLKKLKDAGIEYRPIVSGNFTNKPVIKYYNYEISGKLNNADQVDSHGFYVGNSNFIITEEINKLHEVLMNV